MSMDYYLAIYLVVFFIIVALIALVKIRHFDSVNSLAIWKKLSKKTHENRPVFKASMLNGTPDLVKKFFLYMIKPDTPLQFVSILKMHGQLSVGNSKQNKILNVECEQILAPMAGFVWKVKSTGGLPYFSGSDGLEKNYCWSRIWLMGIWPLSQKKRDANIVKSSFGRMTAEATIWALASLLPQNKVKWEEIDNETIRVTVKTKLISQQVNITVTPSGMPTEIIFPRWNNANPKKKFQFQKYGAKLSSFKEIQGFMIPMQVEVGIHYGTKNYFPFYKMQVDNYTFS